MIDSCLRKAGHTGRCYLANRETLSDFRTSASSLTSTDTTITIPDIDITVAGAFHLKALHIRVIYDRSKSQNESSGANSSMAEQLPQHSAAAFMAMNGAHEVARQIRRDLVLIGEEKPCSWVALYAPASKTVRASEIAQCLTPSSVLSSDIKLMLYESMITRLSQHLHCNGIFATQYEVSQRLKAAHQRPRQISCELINTTLDVLSSLVELSVLNAASSLRAAMDLLQQMSTVEDENTINQREVCVGKKSSQGSKIPKPPAIPRKRLCYICRVCLTVPHPTQSSMCTPCGAFNLASSQLSNPPYLSLPPEFTALVTGARINLGYHTALRLLRCGARVLATTRYPKDAVARYTEEEDFPAWKDRLRILGADFRSAADVFTLVEDTRRCLEGWGGVRRLHLLVNNAAQTLTDSENKEKHAIERETESHELAERSGLYISSAYRPRVRGGGMLMALSGIDKERDLVEDGRTDIPSQLFPVPRYHGDRNIDLRSKSSWTQSLFEIPYEDIISAHSVNTFVPLILCRELLPLMNQCPGVPPSTDERSHSTKPEAYIINVSSREGIFENRTQSIGKTGKHVHTNMSKAALNMITETEAASAWRSRRVAMNTIDPGYMSAAPEYEDSFDGQRPISWEDGAGRVLWPVAVGEIEGKSVWGRFLKHYGAVEVDPGAGRG